MFSKQKGLTLVFRNDPLESLKVSSTFDSIPFVRDYLQKEIEGQLRTLMMEELPAIIHRLSLQLWCPDHKSPDSEAKTSEEDTDEVAIDPFASPPQDPVDSRGNVLDEHEVSMLSLEGGSETHSLFSQKNLVRLAVLTDSHRTLSLFTPSIRDAVFRAWAGPSERGDGAGTSTPSLTRTHSSTGSTGTTYTFSDSGADNNIMPSRPSLTSMQSATTGLSLGSSRHRGNANRKKKNRVVNLRRKTADDSSSDCGSSTASTEVTSCTASESGASTRVAAEPEEELITPPRTPSNRVRFRSGSELTDGGDSTPRAMRPMTPVRKTELPTLTPSAPISMASTQQRPHTPNEQRFSRQHRPTFSPQPPPQAHSRAYPSEKAAAPPAPVLAPFTFGPSTLPDTPSGGIVEQAWIMKMAGEIARRTGDRKQNDEGGMWRDTEDMPPPAYEAH